MSEKRKRDGKQGGNVELDVKTGSAEGPHAVGIGVVMTGPCAGNQKIKAEIGSVIGDKTAVVVGAIVGGCTEDES